MSRALIDKIATIISLILTATIVLIGGYFIYRSSIHKMIFTSSAPNLLEDQPISSSERIDHEKVEEELNRLATEKRLAEERARAEAEAKRKAEEAARQKAAAEAEAKRKAEEAAKQKAAAEAEAKRKAEEAAKQKAAAEAEAKRKAEEAAKQKAAAEAEAKRKAEEAAKQKAAAEAEAKRKAEEAAKQKAAAEAEAKRKAEEAAKQKAAAEAEAKRKAEEAAKAERIKSALNAGYISQVHGYLYAAWLPPLGSYNLKADAKILVDTNGRVKSATIIKSSGDPLFDQSVLDAINSSSPLPMPNDADARAHLAKPTEGFIITFSPQ